MRNKRFHDIMLLAATLVWGSSFFIVKDLVASVNPFVMVAYRFLIASVFVALLAFVLKKNLLGNILEGLILAFTVWLITVLQAVGMVYTTASNSGFITAMFVVFVPIFSILLFGGKLKKSSLLAIVIDVAGLWFLTEGLKAINLGDFLTMLAAVASAFHILFIDKFGKKGLDPLVLCFQQFFFAGLLSLITALVMGYSFSIVWGKAVYSLAFLIALPTIFSFLAQIFSQKHVDAIRASLIYTLEPVFAAVLAWTLGGEKAISVRVLGGCLIFAGMIISDIPWKFRGGTR